jgi:adenosylhomocysteine nucleosidase
MREFVFLFVLLFADPALAESPATRPAAPPVTGIIGAMRVEVELLEQQMADRTTDTVGGVSFVRGTLAGRGVIVAESGIGKVNAAMTAALLSDRYHPSEVLFTGIAGGIADEERPGDIVIATRTAQHDFGLVTDDGFTPDRVTDPKTGAKVPIFEEADPHLLAVAQAAAEKLSLQEIHAGAKARKPAVRCGVVVSGDVFVASPRRKAELRRDFGADAVEMEGAAVAHVCRAMGVPCLIIRSISDTADAAADADEAAFGKTAASNSAAIVHAIVERLENGGGAVVNPPARSDSSRTAETPPARK